MCECMRSKGETGLEVVGLEGGYLCLEMRDIVCQRQRARLGTGKRIASRVPCIILFSYEMAGYPMSSRSFDGLLFVRNPARLSRPAVHRWMERARIHDVTSKDLVLMANGNVGISAEGRRENAKRKVAALGTDNFERATGNISWTSVIPLP